MPNCNFMEITLRHGCSPVNLLHISRTPLKNTSFWTAASVCMMEIFVKIVKDVLLRLRQFLATEKNAENAFYFTIKALLLLKIFKFLP